MTNSLGTDGLVERLRSTAQRFYIQWATVCWQVRDRETQQAVAWHKSEQKAKSDARARNRESST